MLKELSRERKGKLIIDMENFYKNKKRILFDINESKLDSPIILIDPTHKARNVLAALSEESLDKFKGAAKKFLKKPSKKDFELKKIDFEKIRKNKDSLIVEIMTSKQAGDIAGTKLLKFYNHFITETSKYFKEIKTDFEYNQEQKALFFFIAKPKKEIILEGPLVVDKKNCERFRKEHKDVFEKKGKLFSKRNIDFNLREFFEEWKDKNKRKIKEMYIFELIAI
jgi:tRNA nucleotidyltransferase (CCA-adding enzyme)